jgi:hypothetical protein
LPALDALGGENSSQTDDQQAQHEKKGVGMLLFICFFIDLAILAFLIFVVPETKDKNPNQLTRGSINISRSSSLVKLDSTITSPLNANKSNFES